MAEAVAERLLDLHCRLISLYVLNEADSLNWECERSFFEKERSSYVIQMWWLYMQGSDFLTYFCFYFILFVPLFFKFVTL